MIKKRAVLAAVASYVQVMPLAAAPDHTPQSINHYEVDIPAGYEIQNVTPPRADFDLYEVHHDGKRAGILTLYFGNFPGFPELKWPGPPHVQVRHGATFKMYPYSRGSRQMEGLIMFGGLTYKKSPGSPFSLIHYRAKDIEDNEARDFAAIIKSIRVSKQHLD